MATIVPDGSSTAAATFVNGGWGDIGFRTPANENTITEFAVGNITERGERGRGEERKGEGEKKEEGKRGGEREEEGRDVNVTVSTLLMMLAKPDKGSDVNVTGVFAAQLGDPDRVIMTLEPDCK